MCCGIESKHTTTVWVLIVFGQQYVEEDDTSRFTHTILVSRIHSFIVWSFLWDLLTWKNESCIKRISADWLLSCCCSPCHHGLFSPCRCTPGGVIAYISSSSSGSSPESCHSDSSNGSYQSSSPPHGSSPSCHQQGQPADPALPAGCQNLPGTQKSGRSSSTAKCGITSKRVTPMCALRSLFQ